MEKRQETKRFFGRAFDATKRIGKKARDILAPKKLEMPEEEQGWLNRNLLRNASPSHYSPAKIRRLVKKGADVNARSRMGRTALMYAAEKRDMKICKFLIKNGARADLEDAEGKTAESIAMSHVELDIVEMLAKLSGNENTLLFLKKIRQR